MITLDKVQDFVLGNMIGHTLKGMASSDEGYNYDHIKMNVIGIDDTTDMDSADLDAIDSKVIAYLDCIGVKSTVVDDLISNNDARSREALSLIVKSFDAEYDLDAISDLSIMFADDMSRNEVTLDSAMPKVKAGYRRTQVVRKGVKKWVNKREPFKKIILSGKQRRALAKARLKAHSSLAGRKRKTSLRKREQFGM